MKYLETTQQDADGSDEVDYDAGQIVHSKAMECCIGNAIDCFRNGLRICMRESTKHEKIIVPTEVSRDNILGELWYALGCAYVQAHRLTAGYKAFENAAKFVPR